MVIYRAFDEVFRSWSHVAVLRVLVDTATGFSGNEAARAAGMTPPAALKALTSLEELGVVHRQRGSREHLFTLNRNHYLVRDALLRLYRSERQFPEVVFVTLSAILRTAVVSAFVFGSVARKEETAQSDLDLCCIVKAEKHKEAVRTLLDKESSGLYKKFGIKLAPLFFTIDEFRKKAKTRNRLVRSVLANNRVIAGRHLRRLSERS